MSRCNHGAREASAVWRFARGAPAAVATIATLLIAACSGGGGGSDAAATTPPPATPSSLQGTVGVGAPLADGKLRIIDANGNVVAHDIPLDAQGRYAAVTLTGPAPYRLEACGYVGAEYQCIYSVADGPGTANVTPLTSAMMLLATGDTPSDLMTGTAPTLTAGNIETAQTQLRTGLAGVLQDAGVAADVDFVKATLNAGSRTGYDRVLDAVGIRTGEDQHPFVQVTPRLGTGNLYLEQGMSSGALTVNAGADQLSLAGLEVLFHHMTDAVVSADTCAATPGGMIANLASNARLTTGQGVSSGPANVAAALCGIFSGAHEDDGLPLFGSRLQSPVLGQCDLSGAAPICRISFALRRPDGDVESISNGLAVTQEAGVWKFLGSAAPVEVRASARAQRDQRVDGETVVSTYQRALAFEIPSLPGVACADVLQRNGDGVWTRVAIYKPHPGIASGQSLSLWQTNSNSGTRSLDPLVGATRSADDSQLQLPNGAEGDALVRNFYRGGRTVRVSLFTDAACSLPAVVGDSNVSNIDVEIEGVPPVSSALAGLSWPELSDATRARLSAVAGDANSQIEFVADWTYLHGPLGLHDTLFCAVDRGNCGRGGPGRLVSGVVRPATTTATLTIPTGSQRLSAGEFKLFSLSGRTGEGLGLQANYSSCPGVPAGQNCFGGPPPQQ